MTKEIYPEEMSMDECDNFESEIIEAGTFREDFEEAVKYAKKNGGEVYTMVDGDDGETVYLKGCHYVNRFAFCVLKAEGLG